MFCIKCGEKLDAEADFCGSCGSAASTLSRAAPPASEPTRALPTEKRWTETWLEEDKKWRRRRYLTICLAPFVAQMVLAPYLGIPLLRYVLLYVYASAGFAFTWFVILHISSLILGACCGLFGQQSRGFLQTIDRLLLAVPLVFLGVCMKYNWIHFPDVLPLWWQMLTPFWLWDLYFWFA